MGALIAVVSSPNWVNSGLERAVYESIIRKREKADTTLVVSPQGNTADA